MNPLLLAEIHKNDKIGERNETIRMFLVLIHCLFHAFSECPRVDGNDF